MVAASLLWLVVGSWPFVGSDFGACVVGKAVVRGNRAGLLRGPWRWFLRGRFNTVSQAMFGSTTLSLLAFRVLIAPVG